MTDWRAAGQRADATRVANMAADPFRTPAKDAIRSWVVHELAAVSPTLVLDLWGGGQSAAEMTAAGLSVLSVEDGRAFDALDVSRARAKRALTICAEAGGYRAGWGSAAKYAPECDAAWLDFMGHLCRDTVRILEACREMKAVAVTLMPDRMAGVANLPIETWIAMYGGAIRKHARLGIGLVRKYRRPGGQWVVVFVARRDSRSDRARNMLTPEQQREQRQRRRADPVKVALDQARQRARYADPEVRARVSATTKARRADPVKGERMREREHAYQTDPETRDRKRRTMRVWKARPENRERAKATHARAYADPEKRKRMQQAAERHRADPEVRDRMNAAARARYAADPKYRERISANWQARRSPRVCPVDGREFLSVRSTYCSRTCSNRAPARAVNRTARERRKAASGGGE